MISSDWLMRFLSGQGLSRGPSERPRGDSGEEESSPQHSSINNSIYDDLRSRLAGLSGQYNESKKGYKYVRGYKDNLAEVEKAYDVLRGGKPSNDFRTYSDRGAGGFGGSKPADPQKAAETWANGTELMKLSGNLPAETFKIDDFNFLNSFRGK